MNKLISATTAVLFCFLLALTLSACGTSGSTTTEVSPTAGTTIQMSVAAGNQQATVSWTDPQYPSGLNETYNVYYSNTPIGANPLNDVGGNNPTVFLIASNTTSPFIHTGLNNGQPYYYFVTRVSGSTQGTPSLGAMAIPQAATPAPPSDINITTSIQSTNNLGAVTLTIPNADPTLTYNVYWSPTNVNYLKANGTLITNAFASTTGGNGITTATFTQSNLAIGATYYYAVTAVGESESAASQVLSAQPVLTNAVNYSSSTVPPTPSQYGSPLSIQADVGNQAVTVTWSAPNTNSTGTPTTKEPYTKLTYTLYYVDPAGNKTAVPNISSTTTTLTLNNGLANGTTYDFYVAAVQNVYTDNTFTKISSSTPTTGSIVSVMPQATVLSVPSAVAASAGNQQVSLSWASVSDPSGGAVTYNVYCTLTPPSSTTQQSSWALIGNTTTNSFVHSGLKTGETYYYVITTVSDQGGQSAYSTQVAISL